MVIKKYTYSYNYSYKDSDGTLKNEKSGQLSSWKQDGDTTAQTTPF